MAGFAVILLFIFSSPGITASTFSPTPEESALLTKNRPAAKLDLSALTPHTEAGRTFFEIDDTALSGGGGWHQQRLHRQSLARRCPLLPVRFRSNVHTPYCMEKCRGRVERGGIR